MTAAARSPLGPALARLRAGTRARVQIIRLAPRAGIAPSAALALAEVAAGALPVLFVAATSVLLGDVPGAVTGGTHSAAWHSMLAAFALGAGAFALQQVAVPLNTTVADALGRRIDGWEYRELMGAALRGTGVEAVEDQAARTDLHAAAESLEFGYFSPGQAFAGLMSLIARYSQLAGSCVVIGLAFSWLAAAGVALALLLFRYGHRGGLGKYAEARMGLMGLERKSDYLRQLGAGPAAGKEIRVFGLIDWLGAFYRRARTEWMVPLWRHRRRISLWPFIGYSACGLTITGAVLAALGDAADGELTLVRFALVAQAVLGAVRLGEYYPEADIQTAIGMIAHTAVGTFAEDVARIEQRRALRPPRERTAERGVIHFDRVSFGYPGAARPVFDGLDLRIPIGRTTAVVGLNGAGKTTLVKLLARLYEPTAGVIRWNGTDIRELPAAQWRAQLSVVFQDFARFPASAAENIGFGAIAGLGDRAGIETAAEAVGLLEALAGLPQGLDTPLDPQAAGGTELSGGQWQRVALARTVFGLRHGASIVVLDEPTANLDVRAESSFFEESRALLDGATTLLISHRFSTVRHADLIAVLEHGRVIEQGDHERLLAADGRYARMFRAQATSYTDAGQPAGRDT
jgi:ATP-binding cassette subfamily B protein